MADTSVLLNLERVGEAELLPRLFGSVFIPPEVAEEFRAQSVTNPRFRGLLLPEWLRIQRAATVPAWINTAEGLDPGESMALSLAIELQADAVLMDEKIGRTAARLHGLTVIGVLGILLRAKDRRCLDSIGPVLEALDRDAGFWISKSLRSEVLRLAGETNRT